MQHSPSQPTASITTDIAAEVQDIGNVTPEVHPILLHGRARRGVSPNHQYWLENRSSLTTTWVNDRPAFEAMHPLTPVDEALHLWSPNMPPRECKQPHFLPSTPQLDIFLVLRQEAHVSTAAEVSRGKLFLLTLYAYLTSRQISLRVWPLFLCPRPPFRTVSFIISPMIKWTHEASWRTDPLPSPDPRRDIRTTPTGESTGGTVSPPPFHSTGMC